MKKMVLTMTAALMITMGTMAQDENKQNVRPERRQMNQTEMIQHRTQQTVEKYGLNEEQAKKLQELNTKYADKMGPRGGRNGGMRPGGSRQFRKDGARPDSLRQQPPSREDMEKMMRQHQEAMAAYDAELQKIMTEDQFKAYKADMEKRMKQGPGNFQRQRPNRNRQNE